MIIEVVGHKGVVGNATFQWFKSMKSPWGVQLIGRDKEDALPGHTDISFICVPESQVDDVAMEVMKYSELVVIRSTVPPGTCNRLQARTGKHVCHNPEFLKEATAVQDMFNPTYILIGACCSKHGALLRELYEPSCAKIIETTTSESEMVKIVTNNYLACLISFWNEIEAIAQASGLSGHRIGAIATHDPRVVTYGARKHHQYAGKCLPKEITQMIKYAEARGVKTPLLHAIEEVNNCQKS